MTDHVEFLQELIIEKNTSANFHAACDYISYLFFNAGSTGIKQHYSSYNFQSTSGGVPTTKELFSDNIATLYKNLSDATFFVFYRNFNASTQDIPFDFGSNSSDYSKRYASYFSSNNDPLVSIPLFSSENPILNCLPPGYSAQNYLGLWLGNQRTLGAAEEDYMNQFIGNYQYSAVHNSTCQNCSQLIQNVAFSWYQFECILESQIHTGNTFHNKDRASCYGDGSFNLKEDNISEVKIYPNPVVSTVNFEGLNEQSEYSMEIFNIAGQIFESGFINGNRFNIESNLPPGIYFVQLFSNENKVETFKIIKVDK